MFETELSQYNKNNPSNVPTVEKRETNKIKKIYNKIN